MSNLKTMGETTITSRNQISLPSKGARGLGWRKGMKLLVKVLDDDTILLMRKPDSYAEAYAGRLGHVFVEPEENRRYLDELRADWDRE